MNPFPLVLSAPSGGGKTTIARRLLRERNDVSYSVSCTTRVPRSGEADGVDYHFLSEAEFVRRRDGGEFAEWATVHGQLYGTLKQAVQDVLDSGKHVVMDIDVQGAAQFAAAYPGSVLVFLLPPSVEVLRARLMGRGSEDREALLRRLCDARDELREVERYDYVVENDELDAAVARVSSVIDAEGVKRQRVLALNEQVAGLIGRLEQEIAAFRRQV